jgi:hypothetical protein
MTGLSANDKVYDGNTTASVAGSAVLSGSVAVGSGSSIDGKWYAGDTVSITGPPGGTFNSKNVADNSVNFVNAVTLSNGICLWLVVCIFSFY